MKCPPETEVNELFSEDEEPEEVKKPGGHNMVTYSNTAQVATLMNTIKYVLCCGVPGLITKIIGGT